jgi:hypothetical protein
MHNSLMLRDILKKNNSDSINLERRKPHNINPCQLANNTIEMTVKLTENHSTPSIFEILEKDIRDFFKKLGDPLKKAPILKLEINLKYSEEITDFNFSIIISTSPNTKITIKSSTIEGFWAGIVYIEKSIEIKGIQFVKKAIEVKKNHSWKIQISQSPRGSNYLVPDLSPDYLSDDNFSLLTHYGINGMLIYGDFLFYSKSKIFPELNDPDFEKNIEILKDATERAKKYGISFYYVPVSPKLDANHPLYVNHPSVKGAKLSWKKSEKVHCLCSSDKQALAYHSEVMKNLFNRVPLLGGLILIVGGESYYHCYMRPAKSLFSRGKKTNCKKCAKSSAEEIISNFVKNTADAVHDSKPSAVILVWPYSAHIWSKDQYQLEFIKKLPKNVSLLSEIDKDQKYQKNEYTKSIWDYSIDYTGPSNRITEQIKTSKNQGLKYFIKSETALGLELFHMPYVPCIQRLAEKWNNINNLKPSGVLQSWLFYGMWGSPAEELGWWFNWNKDAEAKHIIEQISQRDFGLAAPIIIESWKNISKAIGHLPCIPPYFTGPFFLGPAHPLFPTKKFTIPKVFHGALYYKQEENATFSEAVLSTYDPVVFNRLPKSPKSWGFNANKGNSPWDLYLDECKKAALISERAYTNLQQIEEQSIVAKMNDFEKKHLNEEKIHIEFLYRTLLTNFNTMKFLLIRDEMIDYQKELKSTLLKEIVSEEMKNTQSSIKIYNLAPWLNLNQRIEGHFFSSLDMIKEKLNIIEKNWI